MRDRGRLAPRLTAIEPRLSKIAMAMATRVGPGRHDVWITSYGAYLPGLSAVGVIALDDVEA